MKRRRRRVRLAHGLRAMERRWALYREMTDAEVDALYMKLKPFLD